MIKYITFKPGNTVRYGQDFSYHIGVPADIRFEVDDDGPFKSKDGLWLKAPGYGGEPYGDGAIFVLWKQAHP
jgi:hypothetical protein